LRRLGRSDLGLGSCWFAFLSRLWLCLGLGLSDLHRYVERAVHIRRGFLENRRSDLLALNDQKLLLGQLRLNCRDTEYGGQRRAKQAERSQQSESPASRSEGSSHAAIELSMVHEGYSLGVD
jgi:hypothetical protein